MKRNTPPARSAWEQSVLAPDNLPYQMFLLVQQMTRRFQEILNPYDMTPLHWGILCCLWREDGLRTSEIGGRLEQLGGTITVGLDALERHELVQRQTDKFDGRVSRIFLTAKGSKLENRLKPDAAALIADMFASLSAEEYASLSAQIAGLRKSFSKSSATPIPGQ